MLTYMGSETRGEVAIPGEDPGANGFSVISGPLV